MESRVDRAFGIGRFGLNGCWPTSSLGFRVWGFKSLGFRG